MANLKHFKPTWFWNSEKNRWEFRTRDGYCASISQDGIDTSGNIIALRARIGAGGTISLIQKFSGTLTGITAVGSGATAVGTVTGMTGIAFGDSVFGNPKAALGGNIGIAGWHVPTTNTVNAYITNTKPDSAGSLAAVGVDILVLRST